MKNNLIRGVVEEINPINRFMSYITLRPIEGIFGLSEVPFYFQISGKYIGKVVDIITSKDADKFKQTIKSSEFSNTIEFQTSFLKKITNSVI